MVETVAIVYWCDGAGHAARSIPVARELESRGVEVSMAGGGPGKPFVEMNGYDHPDLTTVAVKGNTPVSFLKHTLFDLAPASVRRFREVHEWLAAEDPDLLVTDDVFAGLSAAVRGTDFYRIDHLTTDLLDTRWAVPLKIYNEVSLAFAEGIIVTSLWPDDPAPEGTTMVPPLAQEGDADGGIEEYDVLLSPGTHGRNFDEIERRLEADGYAVRTVGDENWEPKPAMTPYTEAANVVVCTGFSSIADTVVAGTPCVIYPFLPFQKGIAQRAENENIEGVSIARTVTEAVDRAEHYCGVDERPDYANGAGEFVDVLLDG